MTAGKACKRISCVVPANAGPITSVSILMVRSAAKLRVSNHEATNLHYPSRRRLRRLVKMRPKSLSLPCFSPAIPAARPRESRDRWDDLTGLSRSHSNSDDKPRCPFPHQWTPRCRRNDLTFSDIGLYSYAFRPGFLTHPSRVNPTWIKGRVARRVRCAGRERWLRNRA